MGERRRPRASRKKRPAADSELASSNEDQPTAAPGQIVSLDTEDEDDVFNPHRLDQSVVALPLLEEIEQQGVDQMFDVIIDLNLEYPENAKGLVIEWIDNLEDEHWLNSTTLNQLNPDAQPVAQIDTVKTRYSLQYIYARIRGDCIRQLVEKSREEATQLAGGLPASESPEMPSPPIIYAHGAIYKIWPDFPVAGHVNRSVSTIKAGAAHRSFGAFGAGVTWAVMDSGIDKTHPHFHQYHNLELGDGPAHRDFTRAYYPDLAAIRRSVLDAYPNRRRRAELRTALRTARSQQVSQAEEDSREAALRDENGHGTHVAGIIAGAISISQTAPQRPADAETEAAPPITIHATVFARSERNVHVRRPLPDIQSISGIAPQCKLLSLKVLDENGKGNASNLIAALEYIQTINRYGRHNRVHGVNMSVGYPFRADWFACGQSPLCVEVDRLVNAGVIVVTAAGNTGYGRLYAGVRGRVVRYTGMDITINDPGNAQLAITVGATHRDMPHIYGVSYFSSKGPTGDGRMKPDLVAPGEKILSCAAGKKLTEVYDTESGGQPQSAAHYIEDSGTSMAAPHVSGAIAAFLSMRTEFKGRPREVKDLFMSTATDLGRARAFQGAGLLDLMRAIQAV